MRVALLHPGEMGAAVGRAFADGGNEVAWASAGRSAASMARAERAGLRDRGDLASLVEGAELVASVCPPAAALDVAEQVLATGWRGCYADLNAVSPATAEAVRDAVEARGAAYVDGGIVGGPPRQPGDTRLYLAGAEASRVAAALRGGRFEVVVLDGPPPAASVLKMAYAGWTKGSSALLLAVVAAATAHGVADDLFAEWDRSQPGLHDRATRTAAATVRKAWRFEGEMHEIADTLAAVGVPEGFHRAAAELYRRIAPLRDADAATVDDVVRALLDPSWRQ